MREYVTASGHVVLLDDDVVLPYRVTIGSHGYAQMTGGEQGRMVLLHRWLLGLVKGDRRQGDHINRDPLDCQRENLRIVSPTENNLNRNVPDRDIPRHIYRTRSGRFEVRIKRYRKLYQLGTHDCVEDALQVRNAALATFGEKPPDSHLQEIRCPTAKTCTG